MDEQQMIFIHEHWTKWVSTYGANGAILINYLLKAWKHFTGGNMQAEFFLSTSKIINELGLARQTLYDTRKKLTQDNLVSITVRNTPYPQTPYYKLNFAHPLLRSTQWDKKIGFYGAPEQYNKLDVWCTNLGEGCTIPGNGCTGIVSVSISNSTSKYNDSKESCDSGESPGNDAAQNAQRRVLHRRVARVLPLPSQSRRTLHRRESIVLAKELYNLWNSLGLPSHKVGSATYDKAIEKASKAIVVHGLRKIQKAIYVYADVYKRLSGSRKASFGFKTYFGEFFGYSTYLQRRIACSKHPLKGLGSMLKICMQGEEYAAEHVVGLPKDPHPESTELAKRLYREVMTNVPREYSIHDEGAFRCIVARLQKLLRTHGDRIVFDASRKPKIYKLVQRFFNSFLREKQVRKRVTPAYFLHESYMTEFTNWMDDNQLLSSRSRR